MKINLYQSITQTRGGDTIEFLDFFNDVKSGRWEDLIHDVRKIDPSKLKEIDGAKKKLPYVTISGTFLHRSNNGLERHSGLLAIDIDKINVQDYEDKLRADPYTFAMFRSASGRGLCVVLTINPRKHLQSFLGAQQYYFEKYGCIIDESCKDVSRPRYASYDPDAYYNPQPRQFDLLVNEIREEKSTPQPYYTNSDIERIVQQIEERKVDITGGYHQWLRIAFALADEFGEAGLDIFLRVSAQSAQFNADQARKQYEACVKARSGRVHIGSFFYAAKNHGVSLRSEATQAIVFRAQIGVKKSVRQDELIELLVDQDGFDPDDVKQVVGQVYANNDSSRNDELPVIKQVLMYIASEYTIRNNVVLDRFEILSDGKWGELQSRHRNQMLIDMHSTISDKVNRAMIDACIDSMQTTWANPVREWFASRGMNYRRGAIKELAETLIGRSEWSSEWESEFDGMTYVEYFVRKWLVGVVATVHGTPARYILTLSGKAQNKGKTHWFKNLLPLELNSDDQKYFSVVFFDKGEKDELQLTRNMLILIDELRGGLHKNLPMLKQLTSTSEISTRPAFKENYGRFERLAGLAATTNDDDFIVDSRENTRLIPINVEDIDDDLYNSISKEDVWTEAYWLWKNGEVKHRLTDLEHAALVEQASRFQSVSPDKDALLEFFEPLEWGNPQHEAIGKAFTATMITSYINARTSGLYLKPREVSKALQECGFSYASRRIDKKPVKQAYLVKELRPYDASSAMGGG